MAWTSERCKTPIMEHRDSLLGKTMHSALYWELHPIGESQTYRLLFIGISMFWWVPRHSRLSWQNLNRWVVQLNLGFNDLLPAAETWCSDLQQTYWIWATFGLKNKDWHFALGCLGLWQKVGIYMIQVKKLEIWNTTQQYQVKTRWVLLRLGWCYMTWGLNCYLYLYP